MARRRRRRGRYQTHCLRGHERTPENVSSNRSCKACVLLRKRLLYRHDLAYRQHRASLARRYYLEHRTELLRREAKRAAARRRQAREER